MHEITDQQMQLDLWDNGLNVHFFCPKNLVQTRA